MGNNMLDNVTARTSETNDAGLIKGETACNRSACQAPLRIGERWWNVSTLSFYCKSCAMRINWHADVVVCIPEQTFKNKKI
jgi:hypothetical protein